ncbi:hypothetical protein AGABI2DRAFT_227511 [Agaricus bisporus var. bisporus H97]|uniref:hypothetical protein n=1 Tax=Agaricus bisporus var. bisporus (strain H97 / ATCC MYA-4626 / FGSC 10389) TaxID=936046 RepID=UPI00029F4FD0|nr:hypothetical protein AGABI2DRAFT_227511 [Agaricus bisporus var. bisporus H97]EKV43659.1 hypothetical protein AGABI2DRAFT_227511 [Agaricus bisporus var. bisporus H97]
MKASFVKLLALTTLICGTAAQKIVLANDDGWATANIREEYKELVAAGFEVILSAPPVDRSGTGRSTATPTPMNVTCEFDTCAVGSPAIGTDPHDRNIHYVHAFPADAVRVGIQDLAKARWGKNPDFVVAGVNIGRNLGPTVHISGTDSAACEAANLGIPSFAFSGQSDNFKFIATKSFPDTPGGDTERCGSRQLPLEQTVSDAGCFATVSVINSTTEDNALAAEQKAVFDRAHSLLTCM